MAVPNGKQQMPCHCCGSDDNQAIASRQDEASKDYKQDFNTEVKGKGKEHFTSRPASESAPLLGQANSSESYGAANGEPNYDALTELEDGVPLPGETTCHAWKREVKTMITSSTSLVVACFLQYSINLVSVFAAGRIGKVELGAVALANMTAGVTCIAPFMGLATSLDTLCAQAFGDGQKHLVGVQCQRMVLFLSCLSAGIAVLWANSESILLRLVDTSEAAQLASIYLKIMIFALPGIVVYETAKRMLQAQGLFKENTYVLFVVAPINLFMNWLLVWRLDMGFIGAPIAVVFSRNLMAVLQVLYILFVNGHQCWGGFSARAFTNWWPMIHLALPGMVMVEAEWLAFEIMTLVSSRFGTDYLAAQSVLITLTTVVFHIPFALSVASSTRIANLIGAGFVDTAKIAAKAAFAVISVLSVVTLTANVMLRHKLPLLFSNDAAVVAITAQLLPLVAFVQIFDGFGGGAHGILRGIGKQSIGGPANLIAYYVISLPISLTLVFKFGWKLEGLWVGLVVGLISVSLIEYGYVLRTDWHKASAEARKRNELG